MADDLMARAEALEATDTDGARLLYREAVRIGIPQAAYRYGELLLDLEEFDEAERVLRDAFSGGDLSCVHPLADVLVETGRADEAVAALRRSFGAGDVRSALHAAVILSDVLDDRREAESWYRRAIDAGDHRAKNDYASFLAEDPARYEEAERLYRDAIADGDDLALGNLGGLELDRENFTAAVRLLAQALEGGNHKVLLQLAEAEEGIGNLDRAEIHLEQAVAHEIPGARLARTNFRAAHRLSNTEEIEREYRAALADDEEDAAFYYALYLGDIGRVDEAIRLYLRAIEEGSDSAQNNVALLYADCGKYDKAEHYFRQAIQFGQLNAALNYGMMLKRVGEHAKLADVVAEARGLGATSQQIAELLKDDS